MILHFFYMHFQCEFTLCEWFRIPFSATHHRFVHKCLMSQENCKYFVQKDTTVVRF